MNINTAAERLSRMLRCKTVSHEDAALDDAAEFTRLHTLLRDFYPALFNASDSEVFGNSMLLRWRGNASNAPAALMLAHMDVVDAAEGWTVSPFSGEIKDGAVWGRGALDMKGELCAMLEAAEELAKSGFVPMSDVYFALSADEETSATRCARFFAKLFKDRNIALEFIFDEGAASILPSAEFGGQKDIAAVAVSEKAYGVIELSCDGEGGHASAPPRHTALGLVAQAIVNIENMPYVTHSTLFHDIIAAGGYGMDIHSPAAKTMCNTTVAVTMANGSSAVNVLPANAWAQLNVRLTPGDDPAELLEHIRNCCPESVTVRYTSLYPMSPVSSEKSRAFGAIKSAVNETFPELCVIPTVMAACTDSVHYISLGADTYRFTPFRSYYSLRHTMHGADERLSIADLAKAIDFYRLLLTKLASDV